MEIKMKLKTWSMYHNPFHYWWRVREHFKRPRAHFVHGRYNGYFGLPISTDYYGLANFFCVGLGWKSKYDSPRHEWDPVICLTFTSPLKTRKHFNGTGFSFRQQYWIGWVFNWIDKDDDDSGVRSMATWEAILDMTVYGKTLDFVREWHKWGYEREITIDDNLKANGIG